jgi:hypothetical protein
MEDSNDGDHHARITALEVNVKSLVNSLHEFKDDVDAKFGHLTVLIQSVRSDITVGSKTQWPTFIGALAVGLVIIGMVGNGYVRDQNRTENEVGILSTKFHQHDSATGIHWSMRERVLNHEVVLEKIQTDIDLIRNWEEKHAEHASRSHVRSDEKIVALERKVFGKE